MNPTTPSTFAAWAEEAYPDAVARHDWAITVAERAWNASSAASRAEIDELREKVERLNLSAVAQENGHLRDIILRAGDVLMMWRANAAQTELDEQYAEELAALLSEGEKTR